MTAVTMWSVRKTTVIRARFRCRPVVRNRGQLGLWTRRTVRIPSTTTAVRRISVTAPAPRVVYQRSVSGTGQCEAPETTTPLPDEDELTPLEGWRLAEELDDVEDVEEVDVEVDDVDAEDVAEAVPGMVAAPIAPNTPRPANAPTALEAVRRVS